jgi:GNAT superfamily N-acetyltransferase
MLPSPAEIAARDARRLGQVMRELGGDVAPLAEGWMACDAPGSWATYAAGVGVERPVTAEVLDALEGFYFRRGRDAAIQTTPYQHPSLFEGLEARGFGLFDTITILARPVDDLPEAPAVPGLRLVRTDPGDPASVQAWVDAQVAGFYDDGPPPPAIPPITARVARNPRVRSWILEVDGEVAGSGGLELYEDFAVLVAGAVRPGFRRRGLHRAFMRARLAEAAAEGCAYALVGSTPGHTTERNALRAGFQVAYTEIGLRKRCRP